MNQPSNLKQNNFDFLLLLAQKTMLQFKKYKWWLLILGVLGAIFWFKVSEILLSAQYSTKALLKVEIAEESLTRTRTNHYRAYSILGIIKTRRFLGKVVDFLDLQFSLLGDDYFRKTVFDSIHYKKSVEYGFYELVKQKNENLKVLFTNRNKGLEKHVIYDSLLSKKVEFENISLVFNDKFIKMHINKDFLIRAYFIKKESAIGRILRNLNPILINRQQFIQINYADQDRYLAKDITNAIATLFIDENVDLKTLKTKKLIENLDEQLAISEAKLLNAEEALKTFRRRNPTVVLTGGAQVEVNNINTLQADNEINQRGFEQLQDAVNRINQTKTLNDKVLVARELLNIANGLGFTTSTILEENLNNKFNEYQDLLEEYPEEHQYVIEAQNEVSEIINRALAFGKNNSLELNDRIQENTSRITSVERHLQYLPAAELQLARFTRDRDITNNTYESIKERYNNARVIEKTASPDVFIIDLALLPSPANNLLNIGITFGGMLLMIVGVPLFLSVLLGYFDNTILSKKEIEKEISPSFIGVIPVIGDISDIPDETELVKRKKIDPKLTTVDYSPSKENEAFRGIRTSIMSEMNYLKEKRVLMVSSHSPGEGKSLIAANVAITFAQNKIPTLLVDADLRRGLLHNMLMVTKSPGLSNILASNVNINGSILDKVIQKSQIPNLFIMSCGDTFPNPAEMIGSKKMENLINLISKKFGIIIFDTAPMGVASDSLNLVKNMDATLLVAMAQKTKINSFVKIYQHIEKIRKGNIIGVVLNGTDGELIKDKYGYSYYHY